MARRCGPREAPRVTKLRASAGCRADRQGLPRGAESTSLWAHQPVEPDRVDRLPSNVCACAPSMPLLGASGWSASPFVPPHEAIGVGQRLPVRVRRLLRVVQFR